MPRLGVAALLFTACGRVDFDAPRPFVPSHLADSVALGAARLELGDATIDTTALTINGGVPPGVAFRLSPQPGGTPLAVLHVAALTITEGATVRVVGANPLVIVAASTIDVDGALDAGARGDTPGPGGFAPRSGASVGGDAPEDATNCDPGGGGGGFAQPGAPGGAQCLTAGAGGALHGDPGLAILVGGSGGGLGSSLCTATQNPGGGGGALQLTAFDAIHIAPSGSISVGGGGGGGGPECGMGDGGGGSGGGAGGAIFLEARTIDVEGMLRVDGGGGGAGGNGQIQNGDISDGDPGRDGTVDGPGAGGVSRARINNTAGDGGRGGDAAVPPMPGERSLNGGGGGGGAGHVVQRVVD